MWKATKCLSCKKSKCADSDPLSGSDQKPIHLLLQNWFFFIYNRENEVTLSTLRLCSKWKFAKSPISEYEKSKFYLYQDGNFLPIRLAKIKKCDDKVCWWTCGETIMWYISDKNKNCANSTKVDLTLFIKVTNVYTFCLAIPLPKIYSIAIPEHAEYVQGYLLHHCFQKKQPNCALIWLNLIYPYLVKYVAIKKKSRIANIIFNKVGRLKQSNSRLTLLLLLLSRVSRVQFCATP